MKKSFLFSALLFSSFAINLIAQEGKTFSTQSKDNSKVSEVSSNEAKVNFITNQGYLSSSSLKDYKNYYGDSLKGFDENAVKANLIYRQFYGAEYFHMMTVQKREFIYNKYKIGYQYSLNATLTNPTGNSGGPRHVGGGSIVSFSPCVNEGFESTAAGAYNTPSQSLAVTGWTIETGNNLGTNGSCITNTAYAYQPGSPEFWIVQTPILGHPAIGTIPNSPLGGTKVAQLNNTTPGILITRISSTFPVTAANTLFQFAFAGAWDGSGHQCCDQPFFRINLYDCQGAPLTCASLSLTPAGSACQSGATGYSLTPGMISWTNWQLKYIDLTPFIGQCITIRVTNGDCDGGAHYGTLYFDAQCGGQYAQGGSGFGGPGGSIAGPVSFCAGSGVAQISAPLGYSSYQWVAPGNQTVAAPQGTMATLTVTNPIPGSVYTVQLNSASGCQYVSTNTIVFTQVNIASVGSSSTCLNGASGSATVVGNGSGSGYNYTWLNSTNSVVGTASIVSNLPAGVYSIGISGVGAAGCGSAATTVTISTAPQGVIPLLKPFCSNQAFLTTNGGTNFHWYNGLTPITGTAGAVAIYTVVSPVNNSVYHLSYTSNQGCQDSIEYTLLQSPPGAISIDNISWVCPGGSNGTAVVNMTAAAGSPPGFNSYSVTNLNVGMPVYNASLTGTPLTSFPLSGLSAGSYDVSAFDGSCLYNAVFNVNAYIFNYTVSLNSATLCPNNSLPANISGLTNPNLFNYLWTPNQYLFGNNAAAPNVIFQPTIAPGTSVTIIYSVTATPQIVNCPLTRTISITAINPPIPTITPIPNMCDNALPYQIAVTPVGGTFYPTFTGTNNPISNTGLLTPNSAGLSLGLNSFTYAIKINTCSASQSATFEISHFNSATLTSSITPVCVTSGATNLMNIVQSAAYGSWIGAGVSGSGSNYSFLPAGLQTSIYPISYNTTSNPNPTVCPANSILNVSVTNTVIPLITQVPPFCTNSAPIAMTVSPAGGTWNNPAVNALTGVITPSSAIPSNSIVNYVVNVGPCVNTNSTILNISQFNAANLTSPVPYLCYNSSPFNLNSIAQFTSYGSWTSPNNNINLSSNLFNPSTFPMSATPHTVTLMYTRTSFPNPNLCPDSKTINVSVYVPPVPTITQAGPFCSRDAAAQLSAVPAIGSWANSSYINSTGLFTPSLSSVGNNAVQYVIGTNTCFTQATKYISVEAFASAAITSKIPDQCNTNSPINLSPFTQNGAGVWAGSGITGTSFNPSATGSGNFVITYKTASSPSGLCPDQSTIAVNVFSLASPVLDPHPVVCNTHLPFQILVSPVGGLFGGANTSGVNIKGLFNPATGIIGDNVINYSITSGPCVAYAQTTITVVKFVSADLAKYPKEVYCKNADEPFNLNGLVVNPNGDWSGPGVGGPGHNIFDPTTANVGINVITYLTRSIPTTDLCNDVKTFNIRVGQAPILTVSTSLINGEGCAPLEIIFYTGTNLGKGSWDFGDGSDPKNDALDVSHVYASPGSYTATYSYTGPDGCAAKPSAVNPAITVYENPVANFLIPDEIFISNPEVQLTNMSTMLNTNKYQWKIENLYTVPEVNPIVKFPKTGKYQVTLLAESSKGCKNEITKTLEVKNDFNVFIPSSFTPNFDGLNDTFLPVFSAYGLDAKSFEMEIFDRWGHSLYRTKDVTKGWDGSVQNKGEQLKEEVYIYKMKYKDLDGNLYNKMGHLSLLK